MQDVQRSIVARGYLGVIGDEDAGDGERKLRRLNGRLVAERDNARVCMEVSRFGRPKSLIVPSALMEAATASLIMDWAFLRKKYWGEVSSHKPVEGAYKGDAEGAQASREGERCDDQDEASAHCESVRWSQRRDRRTESARRRRGGWRARALEAGARANVGEVLVVQVPDGGHVGLAHHQARHATLQHHIASRRLSLSTLKGEKGGGCARRRC